MKIKKMFVASILAITALLLILGATSCSLIHEHSFSEWEIVAEPTCTSFGLSKRACECGYTEYDTSDALAHTIVTDAAIDATCASNGKTEGSHCSNCGFVITAQTETAKLPHSFSEWEVVTASTCTSFGLSKRACECGYTEYDTSDALAHTIVTDAAIAATCVEPGKTEGSHCSTCGAIILPQTTTLSTGHNLGDVTVLEEALCNKNGTKRYSCTNGDCDYYTDETYSLPSLDSAAIYDAAAQYTGRLITLGNLGHFICDSSAFVISADGKIVTCSYPIDNAYSAIFVLGENYYDVTEVLAYNHGAGIAVLKIDATDLPYAKFSESEPANGETVYSVGTPAGLPISISNGVISNANREIYGVSFIQHDADMTPGYFGGPLLNRLGEVVGVNVWYFGDEDEDVNLATGVSEIETLDYSNPMSMEEYGALTYTPVDQLDVWIRSFAIASGNNSVAYIVQGSSFNYALGYDTVDNYSFVEGYWALADNCEIRLRIILNNSDGTYEYHAIFTDGAKQNEIVGYIDAASYSKDTVLTYDTFYGRYWTESELMAMYSTAVYDTLGFFSYCLDTYFDTLTLETFGFTSVSYDRDAEALNKLQGFVAANGMYEEITGSYVLSGSSQKGDDVMNFNIAYHVETGNTVVSVHYILASGAKYSAYLTLNPSENGNRFDFMYYTHNGTEYVVQNMAWGYLDPNTFTATTKLNCYVFDGMNEYEDGLLLDYTSFLDYMMRLLNDSVMPSVSPELTVKDLGFFFYFG